MDPSGKGPNGVQGLVTPKGTNSPSLGLVRDPKQLHQLYMTAPAPEERQRWARGDSNGHRERPMGPSSLAHTFCPGAPAGGTHPRASQNLHHRHGRTRSISRPRPSKAGLPGKTTTVTLSALSASMTPAGGGQGPRAPPPVLTIKASRCDKRTSRSRLPVRVECCSVPGPAYPSTHGTKHNRSRRTRPTCAAPRGAPAATRHGRDKDDPPTPGITLQNSAQGPRVPIRLLPLAQTPLPRLSDFTPDHPQPLPWSISRCPHPHISWASVCTRTQGEGRKTPRFFNRKTS